MTLAPVIPLHTPPGDVCEARGGIAHIEQWALHEHDIQPTPCGLETLCDPCREQHLAICLDCAEMDGDSVSDADLDAWHGFDACEGDN